MSDKRILTPADPGYYGQTLSGTRAITGGESDRDEKKYRHDLSGNSKRKNFDEKIFMFPDSYNALRKELSTNYPNLWAVVGWRMAFRAEEFVECMNAALDINVVFDTEKVDFICKTYLARLEEIRKNGGFIALEGNSDNGARQLFDQFGKEYLPDDATLQGVKNVK